MFPFKLRVNHILVIPNIFKAHGKFYGEFIKYSVTEKLEFK